MEGKAGSQLCSQSPGTLANVRLCEGSKKPLSDLDASTEHSPEPSKSGWNPGHWASHAQMCPIRPRFLQWRGRASPFGEAPEQKRTEME